GRDLLPVRQGPGRGRRADVRQRGGGVTIPDPGAVGVLRAVGRRRAVPAVLGHVPGAGRGGGGRADGGDGRAAAGATPAILTRELPPATASPSEGPVRLVRRGGAMGWALSSI